MRLLQPHRAGAEPSPPRAGANRPRWLRTRPGQHHELDPEGQGKDIAGPLGRRGPAGQGHTATESETLQCTQSLPWEPTIHAWEREGRDKDMTAWLVHLFLILFPSSTAASARVHSSLASLQHAPSSLPRGRAAWDKRDEVPAGAGVGRRMPAIPQWPTPLTTQQGAKDVNRARPPPPTRVTPARPARLRRCSVPPRDRARGPGAGTAELLAPPADRGYSC